MSDPNSEELDLDQVAEEGFSLFRRLADITESYLGENEDSPIAAGAVVIAASMLLGSMEAAAEHPASMRMYQELSQIGRANVLMLYAAHKTKEARKGELGSSSQG